MKHIAQQMRRCTLTSRPRTPAPHHIDERNLMLALGIIDTL